jgi:hypothetical protein
MVLFANGRLYGAALYSPDELQEERGRLPPRLPVAGAVQPTGLGLGQHF